MWDAPKDKDADGERNGCAQHDSDRLAEMLGNRARHQCANGHEAKKGQAVNGHDAPAQLIRYQFGNHLGSASLELDEGAQIISYEEYSPYGSSTYQAVRTQTETAKRYRYTGKERDEESGLYYHGARYYAAWLGRWVSADPAGLVDGTNIHAYARDNPSRFNDPSGQMTAQQEIEMRNEQRKLQGHLSPDQIGDVYRKAEDVPKNLDKPVNPSVDTVLQQKRRLHQGEAQRAQTKPPPIITKEEKFEAAKAGARIAVVDESGAVKTFDVLIEYEPTFFATEVDAP